MGPGVTQLSQQGQEGPRAELLSHGFCREREARLLEGVTEHGRGDRAVGPAVAELSASGGRGDAGRSRAPRITRPLHPPQ